MTYRTTGTKQKKPRFRLIRETIDELKKVVWLTRQEAAYLTALVLIIAIIVGIFLGTIDFGFTKLVDKVFLGR
ncbi:preprotein translocase subunit SecE [Chloroflexota bacterium]